MAVFKIEKDRNYTVMSNYHLRDKNLTYKAKGLLSFMLSLPDDWDYSLKGLCVISKENETSIKSALKELKNNGYLVIEKLYPNQTSTGKIEYRYNIYEMPKKNQEGENLPLESQTLENQLQINTNIINTNKQIDKDDKTNMSSFFVAEEHNILTLELINRGYITEDDIQIFYYDNLFEQLLEEGNTYKDLVQIVQYIIPRVVNRKFKDEEGNIIENKFGYFKNSIISNINRLNLSIYDLWGEDILGELYDFN